MAIMKIFVTWQLQHVLVHSSNLDQYIDRELKHLVKSSLDMDSTTQTYCTLENSGNTLYYSLHLYLPTGS